MASVSGGVWLTTWSMYLWFQTSFSLGATFRSPTMTMGALGSRRRASSVSRS